MDKPVRASDIDAQADPQALARSIARRRTAVAAVSRKISGSAGTLAETERRAQKASQDAMRRFRERQGRPDA